MTLLCASVHKRKEQKTEKNFIKDNLVQAYWAARDTMTAPATLTERSLTVYPNVRLRPNVEHFLMVTMTLTKKWVITSLVSYICHT